MSVFIVELHNVTKWVKMNNRVLNITKTKCIGLDSRNVLTNLNPSVDGISLKEVYKIKLLYVNLDNSLSWSDH